MTLLAMRDAIASTIQTKVPGLREVKAHGGTFTRAEVRRIGLRLPTVLVTCLGASPQPRNGSVSLDARWAAWVVTQDEVESPRGDSALAFAELLQMLIPLERWDLDYAGPAREVRAENLFSGELDKGGAALWVVTWRQSCESTGVDLATLEDFLRLHAAHDVAVADETPEALDVVELEPTEAP